MEGPPQQASPRATRKQIVLTTLLCALAALVLSGGLFAWWLFTPPPMPQTPDEAARLLHSLRFHRLPAARKLDYGNHIRDLLLAASDAERQAFFDRIGDRAALRDAIEDMQREALIRRARQYALADEMGRRRLIGEMFAEFLQMRGLLRGVRMPGTEEGAAPKTPEERRREREERRAEFAGEIEAAAATGNPQDMQLVGELFDGIRRQMGGMFGRSPRPAGAAPNAPAAPDNPPGSR